jgi:acyl-CoA thioesterase FadM
MRTYHEARVEPADIDNLGHMNVRVYARHAAAGVHKLMAAVGLDQAALDGLQVRILQPDCHTLFRREQLLGAPLGVRAGVLDSREACIEAYLELFNRDTDELAATFRKEVRLVRRVDAEPADFPDAVLRRAQQLKVEWPAHGRPRSLSLEAVRRDVTPMDMASRGIELRFDGYEVLPSASTPEGFMDLSAAPWLAFAEVPIKREVPGDAEEESWFHDGNVSIATLESRHTLVAVPRTGDIVVTYTAITDVRHKIMRFCHWSFARDSGRLLAVLDEIGIGLNLETRRSCEFPPAMRAELEANSHPELIS